MATLSSQIIMIVVAFSVITICYVIFKLKARFAKGRLIQSIVVDDRIVLVTLLHHSSGGGISSLSSGSYSIRLKFIDMHSGKAIGQNTISRQFEIKMAVNGIIWLTLNRARYQKQADQELIALDIFLNKKVFDQDELKKNLGIAKDETINSMDLDSKTGHISIVSATGFNHTFDCTLLQAVGASKAILLPSETNTNDKTTHYGSFYFERIMNASRYQLLYNKKPFMENQTFVNPICLFSINEKDSNAALIFLHQKDLTEKTTSYISIAKPGSLKITELIALTPAEKKIIEVRIISEINSHAYALILGSKEDMVIGIDKAREKISWIFKN